MTRDLVAIGLAGITVLAIGAAAGSMASAVDTTPDEAINVGYEAIPLDGDTVDRLKTQLQSGESPVERSRSGGPSQRQSGAGGQGNDLGGGGGGGSEGVSAGGGSGPGPGDSQDRLDWLWELLTAILDALATLVALVVVLVGPWLVIRYRRPLLDALLSLWPADGYDGPEPATDGGDRPRPPAAPANDVSRDYYRLVERLGLADRPSLTPGECAATALEAGVDPGPVDRLTGLFEQVRYGGSSVTDRHRRQSREALGEILDQLPEGGHR